MDIIFTLSEVVLLSIIIYQDFRFRAVIWIVFPALFVVLLSGTLFLYNLHFAIKCLLFNCLFVIFQFALVFLYYQMKNLKINKVTREYIGWGDIFFLFAVTPAFPIPIFIFYLVSGYLLTLLVFLILRQTRQKNIDSSYPIPLAGTLSVWLILTKVIEPVLPRIF
jgi:hypothetical protein